jgi:hypothetical protein
MNHTDALNHILSNSCSNPTGSPDGSHTYRIDLCCRALIVTAIMLTNAFENNDGTMTDATFQILAIEFD